MAVYVTVANINDNSPVISVNGSSDIEEVTLPVEEAQLSGLLVFVVEVLLQTYLQDNHASASVALLHFTDDKYIHITNG